MSAEAFTLAAHAHQPPPAPPARATLKSLLDDYERALILKALEEAGGHQRRAAAALGILPTTLNEKMRRLHLRPFARTPKATRT